MFVSSPIGGRGALREIFEDSRDLEEVLHSPRSDHEVVTERLYHHYRQKFPSFSSAVLGSSFTQRMSGFFRAPASSLYSFNIFADRDSELWFSAVGSTTSNLTLIAQTPASGTGQR